MKTMALISIKRVDHVANEFQEVGGAGFLTLDIGMLEFAALPARASSRKLQVEYIADLLDEDLDILDTKPILRSVAIAKLGLTAFLKGRARATAGEHHLDDYVDMASYAALAGETAEGESRVGR